MPKRKRKKKKERKPWFDDLSPQARQAIAAILIAVLGVFLGFSLVGYGGLIGEYADAGMRFLLGGGAYLVPVACLFFIYAFLNPKENEEVSTSKLIGIVLFFLSLFGGLEIYQEDNGGLVGWAIEAPLTYLLESVVASVLLAALGIIGIALTFNTGFRFGQLFKKREHTDEEEDEDLDLLGIEETQDEEESEPEETEEAADDTPPKPKKKPLSLGFGSQKQSDLVVSHFSGPYDPPPFSLLRKDNSKPKVGDAKANSNIIKRTLKEFGIDVEMEEVETGPTITRYSLKPAQGVKISRIVGLKQELQLNLSTNSLRIEAPIPGKSLVGIEIPNVSRGSIGLSSLLMTPEFTDSPHPLYVALGKDVTGHAHFANIARMPHALIAGTTGSGKSVTIHNLIVSLLYRNSPEQLRFIMVDPKRVELTLYQNIPHLLTPVITEAKKVVMTLKWAIKEMERRYDILQSEKVQNIATYHKDVYQPAKEEWEKGGGNEEEDSAELPEALPYIVIVMDELADLMTAYPKELEAGIVRLAQMSRAVGIHLILATQRPSVNVITGTIKANIPTRLALNVASQVDSRTILDQVGAETLLGQGDMLFNSNESSKPIRLQSAFVSDDEIKKVVEYLKKQDEGQTLDSIDFDALSQGGTGDSFIGAIAGSEDDEEDELYEAAKQAVIEANKASTSYLQRKLRIGYGRAARLIDILEDNGIIGPGQGAKPREILIGSEGFDPDDALGESDDDEEDEQSTR